MTPIIGIDLGGTRIKGALFDVETGRLLDSDTVPTRDGETAVGDEPAFLEEARGLVESLEKAAGLQALRIGVSAPGLATRDATAIDYMPGRLEGLQGLNWAEALDRPGAVLNDAHAALMGEIWQGSARGLNDVVFLTLGTGVGGAVVSDGHLLRGHLGRAGHLGHVALDFRAEGDICGTPGSLEDLVGNHTVAARSAGRYGSTQELVEAVKNRDPDATEIWEESMRALAAGIASLINAFDPEAVLIGGGISDAWESMEAPLRRWMDRFEWRPGGFRVDIRRASLGAWAGVYGAAWFAWHKKDRAA
ncbi:MAG: ROK family protein [Verrucomicrobiae bacterium]|nr:ROK family protein [Verrucomicrobiae bacterium]